MIRAVRRESPEAALAVRLSKILYYLVDNIYVNILSQLVGWDQEQSGWTEHPAPTWGSNKNPPKQEAWTGQSQE